MIYHPTAGAGIFFSFLYDDTGQRQAGKENVKP